MQLNGFTTYQLSLPLQPPVVSGVGRLDVIEHVLLELHAEGMTGIGYAFALVPRHAQAIRALVTDLAESLVGHDVTSVRALWYELWSRISYVGQSGLAVMALAAVDTALWDLFAQQAGKPLYQVLGAMRDEVPVYVTGGWLSTSDEDLVREGIALKSAGHSAFKMKVGSPDWRRDLDRVRILREAVGSDFEILVDANQAWTVSDSIRAGHVLEQLGVNWLEEPVLATDIDGSANVARALDLRIASGENAFTRHDFLPLIKAQAADVLMLDVGRCGGPTEFLKIAAIAEAYCLPVSSHVFTEISAHLIAACPNGTFVEYLPAWWDGLFEGAPVVRGGRIRLSDEPGLGFRFSPEAIAKYAVD